MDSRNRVFKTSHLISCRYPLRLPFAQSTLTAIKNQSGHRSVFRSRAVTSPGTSRPSKTIDGEGGQQNDRSAILLTPSPNIQILERRDMDILVFDGRD